MIGNTGDQGPQGPRGHHGPIGPQSDTIDALWLRVTAIAAGIVSTVALAIELIQLH